MLSRVQRGSVKKALSKRVCYEYVRPGTMNLEEAKARAKALLTVIEASYAIKIVNLDGVIAVITEETRDEQKILSICTALNTWVALNAPPSGEVEMPLEVVRSIAGGIL